MPIACDALTFAVLSGTPVVSSEKCVYLKFRKLVALITHEPSAVPIFCHDSLPVPAVGAVNWPNSELVSSRLESR